MALDLNRDTYENETLKADKPVMVDFWGPQCRPCLALMPSVEKLEKEFAGKIKIAKVNSAENRMLCARLRVIGLPAFVFYKNGAEFKRVAGEQVSENDLREAIKAVIA